MYVATTLRCISSSVCIFHFPGDRQFQLPLPGRFRAVLHARRLELRVGDDHQAGIRGLPAGGLHHSGGDGGKQDVLHPGGHR